MYSARIIATIFIIAQLLLRNTTTASAQVYPELKFHADSVRIIDSIKVQDSIKKQDSINKILPYVTTTYMKEIPFNRRYFHEDKIDKELKRADGLDGVQDNFIKIYPDSTKNVLISKHILKEAAFLEVMVENMPMFERDSFADNQERIRCLNAVYNLIKDFNTDANPDATYYKALVGNMHDFLVAYSEDKLWSFTVKNCNIYTLNNSKLLFENQKELKAYLYLRLSETDPVGIFKRLPEYYNDTFASTIVSRAAQVEPDLIFNYATSTNNVLKTPIIRCKDPFVKAIVTIATRSRSPIRAMSFLSDIFYERKSIAQVDAITDSAEWYYQNLVRLKMQNDSIGRKNYTQDLALRSLRYTREMNELHEAKDEVRFKCIECLSKTELYYAIVYGQDEIYTSSFLGSFKRLIQKMAPMKGDEFLDTLHYDHFRTFIRMCAGYNTLSDFLKTMDDSSKNKLMSSFIDNLQYGKEEELEDAVDVADAFGSITDSALSQFLQQKVKENYERSYKERSKKGMVIYSLLARLFEGAKISTNDNNIKVVSDRVGLPNINHVSYSDLLNDSGIVYQQVFFYGDEDGMKSYEHFLEQFRRDSKWKISSEKYWSVISSTGNKKVVIYANLPLPEPEDDQAIDTLCSFLKSKNIFPSVMVHRGHSYHLNNTLEKLEKHVKVVILGSCGGYHNLAKVLDKSPDAHIVSSKQTGTMGVNDEILKLLNGSLIAGQDVNWVGMWKTLEDGFNKSKDSSNKDKFSDYVPPYKNLGAIFIKAYRRMMKM